MQIPYSHWTDDNPYFIVICINDPGDVLALVDGEQDFQILYFSQSSIYKGKRRRLLDLFLTTKIRCRIATGGLQLWVLKDVLFIQCFHYYFGADKNGPVQNLFEFIVDTSCLN